MAGGRGKWWMDGGDMPKEADVRTIGASNPFPPSYKFENGSFRKDNNLYTFNDESFLNVKINRSDK